MWCRTRNRAGLQFKCVVTDNPPRPGEVDHTTEVYVFAHWCWFFYVPQEQISESAMRRDLRFFRPYPRRLESLTVYRCHCKGSTFSLVILRPWVLLRPGFEPTTSRLADRLSPSWAGRRTIYWIYSWYWPRLSLIWWKEMQSNPLLISHARVWILHLLCQNTYRDQRLPLTWKDENFFAILPCACNIFFFLSPDF